MFIFAMMDEPGTSLKLKSERIFHWITTKIIFMGVVLIKNI